MSRPDFPTRRVCLILLSGIGDVVHGLPLVNALKRDDPERHVTWIVQPTPGALLDPHPAVDEVVVFDRHAGVKGVLDLWRALRGRRFDVILNATIYFKSVFPLCMARAGTRVGFDRDRAADLTWLLHDRRMPPRGPRHRQDMYLELVEELGVDPRPLRWRVTLTDEERRARRRFFEQLGAERVAGIVTTSAMTPKDWPVERFSALATRLERDFGYRVVLLGGPGARERNRARRIAQETAADVVWALGPKLRRLVYLVDGCDLLVAPDTGPLHIARALETPVVGLYGHTDPHRAGPYGRYGELVVDRYNYDAEGVPYSGPEEPRHPARVGARSGRMERIEVDDVLAKVALARDRYPEGGRRSPTDERVDASRAQPDESSA